MGTNHPNAAGYYNKSSNVEGVVATNRPYWTGRLIYIDGKIFFLSFNALILLMPIAGSF